MKARIVLVVSAVAITMLAAGCSSGSGVAAPKLKLEKTSIVVDAFPAIDSAGLYIAKMEACSPPRGCTSRSCRRTVPRRPRKP